MMKTIGASVIIVVSILSPFGNAESLACRYRPSLTFEYNGPAGIAIRRDVNRLLSGCEKIPSSAQATLKSFQEFEKKCRGLCQEDLGSSSIESDRCRAECSKAARTSFMIARAYFDGKEDGASDCAPKEDNSNDKTTK